MGVPLFFQRIIKGHFPAAVSERKPRCTTLAIDFAGIEHTTLAAVKEKYPFWTMRQYLNALGEAIADLVRKAEVQQTLIICRDGMAPMGKMTQQRRRRFRAARESADIVESADTVGSADSAEVKETEEWTPPFESNALSPGSEVSIQIDNFLQDYIRKNLASNLPTQVIFSGYQDPGEGEHKIIKYIKDLLEEEPKNLEKLFVEMNRAYHLHNASEENQPDLLTAIKLTKWREMSKDEILRKLSIHRNHIPEGFYEKFKNLFSHNESILVHGLDADLIFLTLPINANIHLWRINDFINQKRYESLLQKTGNEASAKRKARVITNEYLNMQTLRDQLRNSKIGVPEFIMGGFIFGNDFIPYLPAFNVVSDISEYYIKNLVGRKFADPFNLNEFQEYLKSFKFLLPQIYGRLTGKIPHVDFRDRIEYPTSINLDHFEDEWRERMTFEKVIPADEIYSVDGEEYLFPPTHEEIHKFSIDYIKTVIWCYRYYQNHTSASWEWIYYNYWSPPIDDILDIEETDLDFSDLEFTYPKFNIAGQLLLILPRDLKTGNPHPMLPKPVQMFQRDFSPIFDFYPLKFKITRDGVNRVSDGFPLLPHIDYDRFKEVMKLANFSSKEKTIYGFDTVKRFTGGVAHLTSLVKPNEEEEEDLEIFLRPSKLIKIEDFWKKKATELFGVNIMNSILPLDERHFSEITLINNLFAPMLKVPVVVKNYIPNVY